MDAQEVEAALRHLERGVLFDGAVAGPEEVEAQDGVFVAPSAGGFAGFGGDEAAAG